MPNRIPVRTAKGRDVLLDRTIDLDSRLRTVLAQCDGKREEEQISARFGAIVDVAQAIDSLLGMALIELPATAAAGAPAVDVVRAPVIGLPEPAAAADIPVPAARVDAADPFAEWFPASMRVPRERAA